MARVLVVDDDADLRRLVEVRLRKHGHAVRTASSAQEALELVDERGAPDVAVLDVSMPGMTGFELLPALRSRAGLESLPAIFLSARVQERDIAFGRSLDAIYLTKPFGATPLLNAIDRAHQPDPDTAW